MPDDDAMLSINDTQGIFGVRLNLIKVVTTVDYYQVYYTELTEIELSRVGENLNDSLLLRCQHTLAAQHLS